MTNKIRTDKNRTCLMQNARTARNLAGIIAFVVLCAQAADPAAAVRGVVRDEGGTPLAEVKVQLCGLETLHDGTWTRELRLGLMRSYATDKKGCFVLPFHEPGMRYDLYFEKIGFAPAFLYAISSSSPELSVVMKRGIAVTGTVKRPTDGKLEPVSGATVELRLPYVDLWYQQRAFTANDGRYTFRVTPPPAGRTWQVVFAGKVVQLEVQEGKPVVGPDFEVGAKRLGDEKGQPKETSER
jgi:hypothetical protein